MSMPAVQPIPMKYRVPEIAFPRGWYCVAESAEVAPDQLLPVSYLDEQMVVYRTREGDAQVADAYCPHLGAHLASHDGCIKEGEITCPFHKWRFDGESGRVTAIPYSDILPPANVALTLHPTREIDGMILRWYDPHGRQPDHEPRPIPALHEDNWVLYGLKRWTTTAPFRDILENLFDTAHIIELHNGHSMPEVRNVERQPYGLSVDYVMNPDAEETQIHGMRCEFTGVTLLTQHFAGEGFATLNIHSFTPLDDERFLQKSRLYLKDMGSPELTDRVGRPFLDRFCYEVEQDFKVLDFKKHLKRPRLCAGDGPIMKFREYAEQFYT
jgi:3-ketosteroid 9alpha-monooxygenase subunit A